MMHNQGPMAFVNSRLVTKQHPLGEHRWQDAREGKVSVTLWLSAVAPDPVVPVTGRV